MMRVIEAEERLAAITDGAAAAGNLDRHEARRHQARLQRAAHGGERPKAAPARPEVIAAMGISVTMPGSASGSAAQPAAAEEGLSDG